MLDNEALAEKAYVSLSGCPLSDKAIEEDVPTLRERGVNVAYNAAVPPMSIRLDRLAIIRELYY